MRSVGGMLKSKIFILSTAVAAVAIGAPSLRAFTVADVERIKTTGSCEGCNLRHANLASEYLANASLAGADLSGANLSGADLSGADLTRAKLGDAVLTDARLVGANLTGANMAGAYMTHADLSQAVWVDGKTCKDHSRGRCETRAQEQPFHGAVTSGKEGE